MLLLTSYMNATETPPTCLRSSLRTRHRTVSLKFHFGRRPARAAAGKKGGASSSKLQNTADADGRFVASNSTEGWGVVPDQHLKLGPVNNKRLLDVKGYLRHSIKQPKLYGT